MIWSCKEGPRRWEILCCSWFPLQHVLQLQPLLPSVPLAGLKGRCPHLTRKWQETPALLSSLQSCHQDWAQVVKHWNKHEWCPASTAGLVGVYFSCKRGQPDHRSPNGEMLLIREFLLSGPFLCHLRYFKAGHLAGSDWTELIPRLEGSYPSSIKERRGLHSQAEESTQPRVWATTSQLIRAHKHTKSWCKYKGSPTVMDI